MQNMAWKTLQDFVVDQGYDGERDKPIRIIVDAGIRGIVNEKKWRLMYESRNKTSHTYNEEIAEQVASSIIETYYEMFIVFETRLQVEKINREAQG